MAVVPHFVFPLNLDSSGHIQTVEQDSDEDILSCVYVALKTPVGTRSGLPTFGVSDYTFVSGAIQTQDLHQEIVTSEPRADLSLSDEIDELVQIVTVGVSNVG